MKEILKNFIKVVTPLIFGIFMIAISLSILLPYVASKHQVYKDIILETTALEGANKSGEMIAIWISLLIGGISTYVFKYFQNKKGKFLLKENYKLDFIGVGIILIPSIFILFFKQEINFYLVFIGIVYYIIYFITNRNTKLSKKILIFLFSLYLFILSLKGITDKIIGNMELIKTDMVFPLVIFIFVFFIFSIKKNKFLKLEQVILLFQIPAPLILVSFLTNKYLLNGKIYKIPLPKSYKIIITMLILILIIINVVQYKKRKDSTLVLFSSIIVVFILHYYKSPMNIDYGDFWHVGEYMSPWHLIVNKHMKLFVEYNGTSGFYGLVFGFFQNVVLNGTALAYSSAMSLTYILWALAIGSVCYFLIKEYSLVLALFIDLPKYDRPILLLLSLLILLLPRLIKKKIRWLQIYVIFSIYGFFYYPLNGVAFAIGLFPFAMIQLYCSIREKILKREMKSIYFWILNVFIIINFIYLHRLIIDMLKNVLLLSSQTKLSDGMAIYDYSIPSDWFLKFFKSDILRRYIWSIFVCLVILTAVLIFWYLTYYYLNKGKKKKLLSKINSPVFLILSSTSIILPINYTYTLIRMDHNGEYARTTPTMVILIGFILSILLYRYGSRLFTKNLKIIFIGLTLGFIYMINGNTIGYEVKEIQKFYIVPEKFVYINGKDIGIPKLGEGFFEDNALNSVKITKENIEKLVPNGERFWPSGKRELLYIFNSKLPVKIDSMVLTKSLKSFRENEKMLNKFPPAFITDAYSVYGSYYTFRWILDHGYVMYIDRGEIFWVRPDIYEKRIGNLSEGRKNMLNTFSSQDIEKIPYSLGNSIETLSNIFSEKKVIDTENLRYLGYQVGKTGINEFKILNNKDPFFIIDLPETISGKDFDFVSIDFSSNYPIQNLKKVRIQLFWESNELTLSENRTLRFDYGNGKLLVPVGIHPAWLYSNITKLRIDFENSVPGMKFKMNKLEFLKLNRNRKE